MALPVLSFQLKSLSIAADTDEEPPSRRMRRSEPGASSGYEKMADVVVDGNGTPVYVDLVAGDMSDVTEAAKQRLLARLRALRPSVAVLQRQTPINKNRHLVQVLDHADELGSLLCVFLQSVRRDNDWFDKMITPYDDILVLGLQWIVPRVDFSAPRVLPQRPHTDVGGRGLVFVLAFDVDGGELGTLIDSDATATPPDTAMFNPRRAASSVFCYDGGLVHSGPAGEAVDIARLEREGPVYYRNRFFVVCCSSGLTETQIGSLRVDNGFLRWMSY